MRRVEFITGAFRWGASQAESHQILLSLLNALIALNRHYLRWHPDTPQLYRSGVRYRREPKGAEKWTTIPVILRKGHADCEDLVGWRVSELNHWGIAARPSFTWRTIGNTRTYHILVFLPSGVTEDPSRILGMGWDES